jgi:hypothetical protein
LRIERAPESRRVDELGENHIAGSGLRCIERVDTRRYDDVRARVAHSVGAIDTLRA